MATTTLPEHITNKEQKKNRVLQHIKSYPNFPKQGINFRDIFPILRSPEAFKDCIDLFVSEIKENFPNAKVVVGLESRGFLFAPMIADRLNISFVPVRKAGKLPGEKISVKYSLEYGEDSVEIAKESIQPGQEVVIVDDLLATGGTMKAAIDLVEKAQGKIVGCLVLVELTQLNGRKQLTSPSFSILQFDG